MPGTGAWLLVAILGFGGAAAAQPDEAPEPPGEEEQERAERRERQRELMEISCRDERGRPESWLDRTHSYLSRRLCEPAAWFDGFFGEDRALEETPVGTFLRLRSSARWDEAEGWSMGLRARGNVQLPGLSERFRLLISRNDDLTGELDDSPSLDDRESRTRLGLRFLASDRARSRFDIDGTVRVTSGDLNPRLSGRYRHVRGLTPDTLARFTQIGFWERHQGVGTTTRLDYEWLPDRNTLVRLTGRGTWSERSRGVDWRSSLIAFRQLNLSSALRAEIGARGRTEPAFETDEYFVAVRYRRQFLRHWLFWEVEPQHAWPLDRRQGRRRSDWRLNLTLEIQFENERSRQRRLRRYLGPEADEHDYRQLEDRPIPVDAPGDRADDPLLEDEEDNGDNGDNGDNDG